MRCISYLQQYNGQWKTSVFLFLIEQQVGNEHLRKQHRNLAELHYSKAVSLFLSLRDAPCELLRTLLERVAFAEFTMAGERFFITVSTTAYSFGLKWGLEITEAFLLTALLCDVLYCVSIGQSSSAAKLKSLTGAIEIMTETRHAYQLIHNELLEEQVNVC